MFCLCWDVGHEWTCHFRLWHSWTKMSWWSTFGKPSLHARWNMQTCLLLSLYFCFIQSFSPLRYFMKPESELLKCSSRSSETKHDPAASSALTCDCVYILPLALESRDRGLNHKTLCMNSEQILSNGKKVRHYDVHSLYGWSQTQPTYEWVQITWPGTDDDRKSIPVPQCLYSLIILR